jgi:hypothetical protein
VHGGRVTGGAHGDSDLRVVDAGEVAGAGGLVLLGLEREGVGVHTRVGGTSVVLEGLHLVEVLALLLLETVLAVEDELEGGEGTDGILSEGGSTTELGPRPSMGAPKVEVETRQLESASWSGVKLDVGIRDAVVKFHMEFVGGGVGEAPHELLDGVVVGEADLLGGAGSRRCRHRCAEPAR